MNTKNKIIAILMASIVAMAIGMPMAIGQNGQVNIGAGVGTVAPTIACPADFQVNPGFKTMTGPFNTTFYINETIDDGNGYDDIVSVSCDAVAVMSAYSAVCTPTETAGDPATDGTYSCEILIDRCIGPGPYNITVTVTDNSSLSNNCTVKVTIPTTIGLELDRNAVNFGDIVPGGDEKVVVGDNNWNTTAGNLTVHGMGNTAIDIDVQSTGLTGPVAIPEGNINSSIMGAYAPSPLNTSHNVDIECCNTHNVDLGLTIDLGTPNGAYVGTVKYIAKAGGV